MNKADIRDVETTEVTLHGERFQVSLNTKWDRGFWKDFKDNWETDTFEFVKRHVTSGCVFFDIGAWIGPLTLYAARLGAHVVALEPDPVARLALKQNCQLNETDVEIVAAGLSTGSQGLTLFGGVRGLGASTTTSLGVDIRHRIKARSIGLNDLLSRQDQRPAVLKMDIEGHEYFLGSDLERLWRQADAPLHLSMHPRTYHKRLINRLTFNQAKKTFDQTWNVVRPFAKRARFADSGEEVSRETLARRFGPRFRQHRNFEIVVGKPSSDIEQA